MKLFFFSFLLFTSIVFGQIKKQEHKEYRTPKEIEQEKVVQQMKASFKNNYALSNNDFYKISSNLTINNNPFYSFDGLSKLQTISPIDCESKYDLDKEKMDEYKNSETSIFKRERAPREAIPFYLTSVFTKLENIYANYPFFSETEFSYNLQSHNDSEFYHLTFKSKNQKLPIQGKIVLYKNSFTPKSLEYLITSDYTFIMSSDNFNHKKNTGYNARVLKELVKIEFKNTGNQFSVSKYQSEFEFKNEQSATQEQINGDLGNSQITLEYVNQEPKICNPTFNLDNLE